MMKKFKILTVAVGAALFMTSCVENSEKYRSLLEQRDSLLNIELQYNQAIDILNSVEKGIADIRAIESRIQAPSDGIEENRQLVNQLKQVKNIVAQNKQKIAELEKKLRAENGYSRALANTIARLKQEVAAKETMIDGLKKELEKKNVDITALNSTIAGLNEEVSSLETDVEGRKKEISEMDKEMNVVYYMAADSRTLKEKGVVSGGLLNRKVLSGGIDHQMFTKTDMREFKEFATGAKKIKVLTSHPEQSYLLTEDKDGNVVLKVRDAALFWSVSKYLVIRK